MFFVKNKKLQISIIFLISINSIRIILQFLKNTTVPDSFYHYWAIKYIISNNGLPNNYNGFFDIIGFITYTYAIGYDILISVFHIFAGIPLHFSCIITNIMITSLIVFFTYKSATLVFDNNTGLLAAIVISSSPYFIFMTTPLGLFSRASSLLFLSIVIYGLIKFIQVEGKKIAFLFVILLSAISSIFVHTFSIIMLIIIIPITFTNYIKFPQPFQCLHKISLYIEGVIFIWVYLFYIEYSVSQGWLVSIISTLGKSGILNMIGLIGFIILLLLRKNRIKKLYSGLYTAGIVILCCSLLEQQIADWNVLLLTILISPNVLKSLLLLKNQYKILNTMKISFFLISIIISVFFGITHYSDKEEMKFSEIDDIESILASDNVNMVFYLDEDLFFQFPTTNLHPAMLLSYMSVVESLFVNHLKNDLEEISWISTLNRIEKGYIQDLTKSLNNKIRLSDEKTLLSILRDYHTDYILAKKDYSLFKFLDLFNISFIRKVDSNQFQLAKINTNSDFISTIRFIEESAINESILAHPIDSIWLPKQNNPFDDLFQSIFNIKKPLSITRSFHSITDMQLYSIRQLINITRAFKHIGNDVSLITKMMEQYLSRYVIIRDNENLTNELLIHNYQIVFYEGGTTLLEKI